MSALILCECGECDCLSTVAIPDSQESDEFGTPICDDCAEDLHDAA